MTKYDEYSLMSENGKVIATFFTKKEAIQRLKELYRMNKSRMYIVDCKGNVVFD